MTTPNRPLLLTKLYPPRVTKKLVTRPRLLARLDLGLSSPLTLVSAAAGYGKSTLVSNWVDTLGLGRGEVEPLPAAWLSLDESDDDFNEFVRYFVAGLRLIFPDAISDTEELLQARLTPPLALIAATLTNEIARLPASFVFVLEDYHLIVTEEIHSLVNALLRRELKQLHLVVITRMDPPLPLATLRAAGKLVEIRGRDLRFTQEETASYFERVLPALTDQPALRQVEQHAEGWIAGLQLATLALTTTSDSDAMLAALAASDADLAGYLGVEVFSRQPPAIQAFLLQTSILDRFCASLCDAVVAPTDPAWQASACIAWLEHADLFVHALNKERVWHRYHHLFRDMLRAKAKALLGEEQLDDLHRKAARWYARRGLVDEGLRHALAVGDRDLAARLMEQGLRDVLNREDRPTLERWLSLMPDEYVQQRPGLLIIKVWALELSWQLEAQAKVLVNVEMLLEQGEGDTLTADELQVLRGQILLIKGQEAYIRNLPRLAAERTRAALTILPQDWTYLRGAATLYLAMSMQPIGEGAAAERMLLDTYESLDVKTDTYALRLLMTLSMNYVQAGDLIHSAQVARVMLEQAAANRLAVQLGWAHYFLGFAHYQWNELDVAALHFAELYAHRHAAQFACARDAAMALALLHQTMGDSDAAWEILEELERTDVLQAGRESDTTAALRAELQLRSGNVEDAARWADSYPVNVPDRALIWFAQPHTTVVRILVARNQNSDAEVALQIVDALYAIASGNSRTRFEIEFLILRALALDAMGKDEAAEFALQQAVELARPGGFIRLFVDNGVRIQHLLGRIAKRGFAPATLRRIQAAFLSAKSNPSLAGAVDREVARTPHPQTSTPIPEALTERELEILAMLGEPLSTKEIAHSFDISPLTVKRHIANLYAKLDVHSRWDAVARAKVLGLLAVS